jgi:hypothetical protein
VTKNSFFGADFFNGLRSLATAHNLALVTASRGALIELCQSEAIRSSPFFNIFASITLHLLEQTEADELIASALAGTGVEFGAEELAVVTQLTGLHPFFLQTAAHFLFAAHTAGLPAAKRRQQVIREFRNEAAPHFLDQWQNSDDRAKIALTAVALLERGDSGAERGKSVEQISKVYRGADRVVEALARRGLLIGQHERYQLFSSALGGWVLQELSATLEEQRSYETWLRDNGPALAKLDGRIRRELGGVLPRIAARYRALLIAWLADPASVVAVVQLLTRSLGASG